MNIFMIILVVIVGAAISVLVSFLIALCYTHPEDIPDEVVQTARV